ncbi:EF-hand domain-containing protein [Saccharothrix sp. Mg75]|uniref:EF-hand domain-containing protein n=1 Tax=Saccharothrix sp. Mg75 TaxID=3445357 RepID=UPI003EE8A4C5
MTMSKSLERTLDQRFDLYDIDKNGYIEESDFREAAKVLAGAYGLPAGSDRAARLGTVMTDMWTNLSRTSDADGDGRIDRAEFKQGFAQQLQGGKEAFTATYQPFVDALMEITDADGDGRIGLDEHTRWYTAVAGVSPQEAAESFRRLDQDGSGFVTRDEISRTLVEDFFSANVEP